MKYVVFIQWVTWSLWVSSCFLATHSLEAYGGLPVIPRFRDIGEQCFNLITHHYLEIYVKSVETSSSFVCLLVLKDVEIVVLKIRETRTVYMCIHVHVYAPRPEVMAYNIQHRRWGHATVITCINPETRVMNIIIVACPLPCVAHMYCPFSSNFWHSHPYIL